MLTLKCLLDNAGVRVPHSEVFPTIFIAWQWYLELVLHSIKHSMYNIKYDVKKWCSVRNGLLIVCPATSNQDLCSSTSYFLLISPPSYLKHLTSSPSAPIILKTDADHPWGVSPPLPSGQWDQSSYDGVQNSVIPQEVSQWPRSPTPHRTPRSAISETKATHGVWTLSSPLGSEISYHMMGRAPGNIKGCIAMNI